MVKIREEFDTEYTYIVKRESLPTEKTLFVSKGNKVVAVKTGEIAFFKLENKIIVAFGLKGEKWFINDSLSNFEADLYPMFFRANRQFLVNKNGIKYAVKLENRTVEVGMVVQSPSQIIISKEKRTEFLRWWRG